jgi:hypothetical protein
MKVGRKSPRLLRSKMNPCFNHDPIEELPEGNMLILKRYLIQFHIDPPR